MPTRTFLAPITLATSLMFSGVVFSGHQDDVAEQSENAASEQVASPKTVEEARGRAKLLHQTIHDTLQVMHRDFFDPDDQSKIPSASLGDVFDELAEKQGIDIRWLAVNATAMNVDHEPRNDFERAAVKALTAGETEYEVVEKDHYHRVGLIVLHNVCLKCHVPNRTSLEDRAAGLVISMPFQDQ